MKSSLIFIFLVITITNFAFCQKHTFNISKDSIPRVIVNLRRDTVIKKVKQTLIGTGTFFATSDNELYIVTASHVSKFMDRKSYFLVQGDDGKPISFRLIDFVPDITPKWKSHPKEDISILRIYPSAQMMITVFQHRFLPLGVFYDSLKPIARDDQLTIYGFPLGLGTKGFLSPLTYRAFASSGLITLNRFDTGVPADFIILENPSVGGYSGGPVFDLGSVQIAGATTMFSCKGTICYGFIHGTISDETGGKLAAITPSYFIYDLLK